MARDLHRNPNYPIQGELRGARAIITNLNQIARSLDLTRLAATKTFSIDRQVKTVGIQIGLNAEKTTQLSDTITGLSNVTGLSTGKTGELVTAMSAAGLSAGDLDASLSDTANTFDTISEGGAKNLEMMSEMVGRYGIAASAVIKTDASLKIMGLGLDKLADKVTKWQKDYKIPGMIGQIPQAVDFAEKSVVKYSALLGISAEKVIADTMKTGATFAQVYGVDIGKAIQMAQANQDHFMQQQATNADVFLGLADSFSPLTNAMFEAGMQFHDIQALMKKGQEDPAAYAEQILKMKKQMEDTYGSGSVHVKRWFQLTLRASSAQAKMYLTEEGALARKKTFHNLINLGKTIFGLTIADKASEAFKGLHDWVSKLNIRTKELSENFGKWMKEHPKEIAMLQRVAKALAIVGGAAGVVAGSISAMVVPLTTLRIAMTNLPLVGGSISKLFVGIGKGAATVGKKLLWPISVIYGAVKAFEDFGKSLSDPNLTGPEKLLKGIRSVFVGIVSAFDDLLMGIPTKIVKFFFPQMRGTLVDGVKRLFNGLQADMNRAGNTSFSVVFDNIKIWIGEKLDGIWGWMSGRLQGWRESAAEMGRSIGRAIGSLAKWAWTGMKWLFNPINWKRGWDKVINWFNSDGTSSFGKIFDGLWDIMSDFVVGATDEVALIFGSSWEEVRAGILDFGDWFKGWGDWFKNVASVPLTLGWLSLKTSALATTVAVIKAWNWMKDIQAAITGWIIEHVVGRLIKDYALLVRAIEWVQNAWSGDADAKKKSEDDYKRRINRANTTAKTLGDAARSAIKWQKLETAQLEKSAKAAKAAHADKYASYDADLKAGRDQHYENESARGKEGRRRNREAKKTGKGRRAAERENALRMGAWADEIRGGIRSRTAWLIASLNRQTGQFIKAGDTHSATKAGHMMRALTQALDSIENENDPKKLLSIMKGAEELAGKKAVNSISSLAPTPTMGDKPELLDVAAQVAKARGEPVSAKPEPQSLPPASIAAPGTPYAPGTSNIIIGLSGVGKELFEIQNPETNHVEISTN